MSNPYIEDETIQIIAMYQSGNSTAMIAKKLHTNRNRVVQRLRYHKVMRPSVGVIVEKEVVEWLSKSKSKVVHMRGDWPFDAVVDGIRVEIKSARRGTIDPRYSFELCHRQSASDYKENVDVFLLVFRDQPGRPVYAISSKHTDTKRTISVGRSLMIKGNRLILIGDLDSPVQAIDWRCSI